MSQSPTFDAFRLARKRDTLRGEATMPQLPRLAQSVLDPKTVVRYEVVGRVDDQGHPGALMRLSARLRMRCERCNGPFDFALEREVPFRFVRNDAELNALPIEDVEDEAVIGSTAMALLPWIEDEAILSLPLVPRHEDCVFPGERDDEPDEGGSRRPFAALAMLKRDRDGGAGGH